MNCTLRPALLCVFALSPLALRAQSSLLAEPAAPAQPGWSTSAAPAEDSPASDGAAGSASQSDTVTRTYNRPFHSIAMAAKVGVNGIGFDAATPVASHLNLRGGAQFFSHDLNPNANGLHSYGQLTLQNVQASLDIYPFRNSGFHISPGITLHNDNHLFTSLFVPGGTTFSLGDADYLSDPKAPITGLARVKFGNQIAPRITLGWGNMLPRNGSRFSVPFEIGFQYISSPTLDLHLYGNACDSMGNCGDINANDGPQNINSEVQSLNQDISTLRFYPILSIGFSYKFGR